MPRALVIAGRGEPPAIADVPDREPAPGQVRVAVQAASVNGIDVFAAGGYVWDSMPHEFPVVLGRDFAGTVAAVGDGVTDLRAGDGVAGAITGLNLYQGAIAERILFDANRLARIPDGVSPIDAAAGGGLAGLSARDLVDALAVTSDDVVLVSGATGGVGALAVQLAAATGATVLATARSGAEDFVLGLGAKHPVDYTGDLATAVRAVAPTGVTAVVHTAGDAALLAALLRPGGRLASAIGATDEQVGRDDVTIVPVLATDTPEKIRGLLDAVAAGELRVPIAKTFPFEQASAAVEAFGQHKLGKLAITMQ
jgi:NADPH:quinone reductase